MVKEVGRKLGLEGTYIARSYIEQVRIKFFRPYVSCQQWQYVGGPSLAPVWWAYLT
jgi:hypothetical protein